MKRYLTTLFIVFVSITANVAVAQQHDTQPKDTVKLRVVNEQVNEDGKTSNIVKLESKDKRVYVKWVEEDTVYHIYTADTIVQLDAVPAQKEILVIRGANAKESGVSCFFSNNGTSPLIEDNGYSHYLCGSYNNRQGQNVNLTKRVTILRLSQNTHSDGIELKFAQERGKGVKARLWRVKPRSNEMKSLPVKVYIKQNNYNSPSLLKEDSIVTLAATDTLKSISIEWNTGKNIFSPTLKIDDRLCELERQNNHYILKDNLDSILRNKGWHHLQFECKMFVSDSDGFKLEPYRVEFKIERNDSNKPFLWDKVISKVKNFDYTEWILILILISVGPILNALKKHSKTLISNKSENSTESSEEGNTSGESHAGEDEDKGSDSEENSSAPQETVVHFEVEMKKDELLMQLQRLIDITTKSEEPQKTGVILKFLEKSILKHYIQDRIKQQGKLEEVCHLLSNLHGALKDSVVDIADYEKLNNEKGELNQEKGNLETDKDAAVSAAKSLYNDQLLFLLKRLYNTYVSDSSDNKQLKSVADLFNKNIDSSNPTELANRFKQKHINVLLAEIELCFVSKNKRNEWCQKYKITYNPKERLEDFVDNIYEKGSANGRAAAEPEIEQLKTENTELAQNNAQLNSKIEDLREKVSDLEEKLKTAQEKLKNRPVIKVPILPEEFEKEKAELIKTHKKEVDALNANIRNLESNIDELKKKLNEEIIALETKHKEEIDKLEETHKKQLAAIDAKHKQDIENLNETIKGLEATITELKKKHKEEISTLETKHKEEVNKLTNAHKGQLAAIDAKHKREIENLNNAHKKEVETLNETIKGLDTTIIELQKKHKEEISDIETKHEEQLGELKAKHTQAINEIRQSHAKEVKVLVDKQNSWCNNFIVEVRQMMDALGLELQNLQTSVDGGPISDRPIFVTAINEMVQFFGVFEANVNKLCDEKGNQDYKDLPAIRESLLTMFNKVLSYSGSWANRLFLLESYSRVPQLAEQMQSRGVDVATIERASAVAKALLSKAGISVVEPAVLAAPFKTDNYDFENTEVLIYRFFPEVSPQDYSGRVFDVVRVGYNVAGGEAKNPVVVYF